MDLDTELRGRKVFVTGSDGFIGSHVVDALIARGADVTALCVYNSFGSRGWLDESKTFAAAERDGQVRTVLGDVRDAEHMRTAIAGHDIVLHLAALIAIPYSYVAPRSYVETNVIGTLNVLEAARAAGVSRMVHTSTSEVYGTPDSVPIREDHALKGQSPYSASKIAADKMAESYARSFDLPVVTLRPFNTFGPRQSARAVIPTVLSQMLAGVQNIRLGALSPQRDFTFATDTAEGFLRAAVAQVGNGEVIQLGTGRTVSIGELVDLCKAVTGSNATIETDEARIRPANSEVEILLSDPQRAKEKLGWEPAVGLEEGLKQTADWLEGRVDAETALRYHT
ncbi:GDP-mannose 4,6-dehydratase [Microbacterium sediminis]|uniref:NAD-dependent dehydratase n=1 Tax=Microbacterium sediminis TaxID=904291 RepID=A0A1B9NE40_9MICO|nr:GDP-mannose 4,6-dehydratase [Microbacterium sediminis]OCG74858.1 NAD-dependent dehydratase [Microbacterium sediminis]QBR75527.1 NAD-dependent epimerase/dehydratase family protein [Microbacterium sediminis]